MCAHPHSHSAKSFTTRVNLLGCLLGLIATMSSYVINIDMRQIASAMPLPLDVRRRTASALAALAVHRGRSSNQNCDSHGQLDCGEIAVKEI